MLAKHYLSDDYKPLLVNTVLVSVLDEKSSINRITFHLSHNLRIKKSLVPL